MGKRELIALLILSSWCLVMVERLFLPVPRGCLQFVIVVFPDHTHLIFLFMLPYHMRKQNLNCQRTTHNKSILLLWSAEKFWMQEGVFVDAAPENEKTEL